MKKIFAAFVAILMSAMATEATAQILSNIEGMPPYKLGASVALNAPTFSGAPYSTTVGFSTGLNLMVDGSEIAKNTFGRVEVRYAMKGASYEGSYHDEVSKSTTSIKDYYTTHYIEIPVHAGYAWYVNEDLSVMAEGGPYFALGLAGHRRTDSTTVMDGGMPFRNSRNEDFFSGKIDANRFDFGLGIQLSAMYLKDYQVHVAYDFGFINMHSSFQQNRNFSVGFTYFFE